MTTIRNAKKKNVIITVACCLVLLVGAMSAYFHDTETKSTTMSIGEVSVELTHPLCDAATDEKDDIVPLQELTMDPTVTNNGSNDAFVFLKVQVPKVTDVTHNAEGAEQASAAVDLFSYTLDDDWTLVKSTTSNETYNEYIYVYGTAQACTRLEPEASTSVLFENSKMTVANIQGTAEIFGSDKTVTIVTSAIQADWIKTSTPSAVLSIIEGMEAE